MFNRYFRILLRMKNLRFQMMMNIKTSLESSTSFEDEHIVVG